MHQYLINISCSVSDSLTRFSPRKHVSSRHGNITLFRHVKTLAPPVQEGGRAGVAPRVYYSAAYLQHHATLLLATLICRPHNRNAISRSPSGASGCVTRRDPQNRFPLPTRPNWLSHLTPLPPTWRKLVRRLRGRLPPAGCAGGSSATPQLGKPSPGRGDARPHRHGWAGLGEESAKSPARGERQLGDVVTVFVIQDTSLH